MEKPPKIPSTEEMPDEALASVHLGRIIASLDGNIAEGESPSVDALRALREQLSRVVAQVEEQERELNTDALTRVPSLRYATRVLGIEIARVQSIEHEQAQEKRRTAFPLYLAMLDLDGFKEVNDTFGHAGGDEYLKHIAQSVERGLRATDTAVPIGTTGRIGGDEFMIVLPGVDPEHARALGERILKLVHEGSEAARAEMLRRFPDKITNDAVGHVSASVGLTRHNGSENAEELRHRADVLMYVAKAGGKSRVVRDADMERLDADGSLRAKYQQPKNPVI